MSRLAAAEAKYSPRPGIRNSVSTNTVPVISAANKGPTTVTNGINELRSACRTITVLRRPPFASAAIT